MVVTALALVDAQFFTVLGCRKILPLAVPIIIVGFLLFDALLVAGAEPIGELAGWVFDAKLGPVLGPQLRKAVFIDKGKELLAGNFSGKAQRQLTVFIINAHKVELVVGIF